jgi:hypothetical protein
MERTKCFVDQIMQFESGMLNDTEIIELFSDMVKTDVAWSLQGHYGRAANALIEGGWLDKEGNILKHLKDYDNI